MEPVAAFVVFYGLVARFPAGDAGLDALFLQRVFEPVGIITPVGEQPLRLGKFVDQGCRTDVVSDLAGG